MYNYKYETSFFIVIFAYIFVITLEASFLTPTNWLNSISFRQFFLRLRLLTLWLHLILVRDFLNSEINVWLNSIFTHLINGSRQLQTIKSNGKFSSWISSCFLYLFELYRIILLIIIILHFIKWKILYFK